MKQPITQETIDLVKEEAKNLKKFASEMEKQCLMRIRTQLWT